MSNTVSIIFTVIEFCSLQMRILDNCHKLFSLSDVKNNVDVWRKFHALDILKANDIFGDVDPVS